MRFICWPFHYQTDHPKNQWCLYSKKLNALSVLFYETLAQPTSSSSSSPIQRALSARIFAISSILARECLAKKLNAFCLHKNKNEKKNSFCAHLQISFKKIIYEKKTFYNLFSSLLLTCVRFLAHTECEGKSAANEFKAFLFWRVSECERENMREVLFKKYLLCAIISKGILTRNVLRFRAKYYLKTIQF